MSGEVNHEAFTGEWIVRVPDLSGPQDAANADAQIRRCLDVLGLRDVEIVFDASRWKGGGF